MYPILLQLQLKLQFACRERCKDGGGLSCQKQTLLHQRFIETFQIFDV